MTDKNYKAYDQLTVSRASSNEEEMIAPSSVISSSITRPLLDNLRNKPSFSHNLVLGNLLCHINRQKISR